MSCVCCSIKAKGKKGKKKGKTPPVSGKKTPAKKSGPGDGAKSKKGTPATADLGKKSPMISEAPTGGSSEGGADGEVVLTQKEAIIGG